MTRRRKIDSFSKAVGLGALDDYSQSRRGRQQLLDPSEKAKAMKGLANLFF